MRRILIGLTTAAVAAAGPLCGDTGGGPHNDPFPPPGEVQEVYVTLKTYVEKRYSPYTVALDIKGGGNGAYPPQVPIASGEWEHKLVYKSGVRMTINMVVIASRPGSTEGYCKITDGVKESEIHFNGEENQNRIRCTLTTQQ